MYLGTSGATERRVYFNDGTTTSGSGVVRMDGSANGMRYRADKIRLFSNLTVNNAVVGDLNGTATNATKILGQEIIVQEPITLHLELLRLAIKDLILILD